jgi:hypothetical protein
LGVFFVGGGDVFESLLAGGGVEFTLTGEEKLVLSGKGATSTLAGEALAVPRVGVAGREVLAASGEEAALALASERVALALVGEGVSLALAGGKGFALADGEGFALADGRAGASTGLLTCIENIVRFT